MVHLNFFTIFICVCQEKTYEKLACAAFNVPGIQLFLLSALSLADRSKSVSDIPVDVGVARKERFEELQKFREQIKDSDDKWQDVSNRYVVIIPVYYRQPQLPLLICKLTEGPQGT